MLNRSKLWAFGLLFAAFAAGIAVGVGAHAAGDDKRRGPRPSYVDRLARELTLSESQRDSIASILANSDTAMQGVWSQVRPQLDAIRSDIRRQIRTVLTLDQLAVYDSLARRSDSLRAAREGNNGNR
jgi:hypothetical protein